MYSLNCYFIDDLRAHLFTIIEMRREEGEREMIYHQEIMMSFNIEYEVTFSFNSIVNECSLRLLLYLSVVVFGVV